MAKSGPPKGNNYWQFRNKHGRDYKYTPEGLWKEFEEYSKWLQENPLYEAKAFSYEGHVTIKEIPRMRAMTLDGFCLFADITLKTFCNYRKKDDFFHVCTRIDKSIRTQKFEGAASDLLNASIIARDLGLKDKVETENKNTNINKDMTDDEFENAIKELGVKKDEEDQETTD
jgi:hypothetical protein